MIGYQCNRDLHKVEKVVNLKGKFKIITKMNPGWHAKIKSNSNMSYASVKNWGML